MSFELSAVILAWIAIALISFALAGVFAQVHQLRQMIAGPPSAGRPKIGSISAVGGRASRRLYLLFADATCGTCAMLVPAFDEFSKSTDDAEFRVVYANSPEPSLMPQHAAAVTRARSAFDDWNIRTTPYLAVVSRDGVLEYSEPIGSLEAMGAIMREAALQHDDARSMHN